MIYTPETLTAKAAEVRRLLSRAVIAFGNPDVLDSVTRLALAHPEIAWEPVALAAAALNAQRDLDEGKRHARHLYPRWLKRCRMEGCRTKRFGTSC